MNEKLVRAVARALTALPVDLTPYDEMKPEIQGLWQHTAKQFLSAIEQAGYAVVPREPTEAMIRAGCDGVDNYFDGTKDAPFEGSVSAAYKAMLAAAERDDDA